jgi:MFS family permease
LNNNRFSNVFYGYYIIATFIVILAFIHGLHSSYGIFFNSLLEEFQCSRTAISGAHSVGFLVGGFAAIILGRLSDRIGPRIILTIAGIVSGLGYFLMSQMTSLWQLYLFYGLIVNIWPMASDVIALTTVARWFVKHRGFASGLVKAGTGIGMMIVPILGSYLISAQGWRTTYLIISILVVTCVVPLSQFLRRDPSLKGLTPYGVVQGQSSDLIKGGFSFREALHTKQFWMLCVTMFTCWFCANSLLVHLTPHAVDSGFSPSMAARLVSIIGGTSIAGRVGVATLGDKIGLRKAMLGCFVLTLLMLTWLCFSTEYWQLALFAFLYGFGHGGFFALISPLLAEMFGTKALGSLFGIVTFCATIGGATGPLTLGMIFDNTGSYRIAFLILIAVIAVGFFLVLLLKPVKYKPTEEMA